MSLCSELRAERIRDLHTAFRRTGERFTGLSHIAFEASGLVSLFPDVESRSCWSESDTNRLRAILKDTDAPLPFDPIGAHTFTPLSFSSREWYGFYYDLTVTRHPLAWPDICDAIQWFETKGEAVIANFCPPSKSSKCERRWIERLYELFPESRASFCVAEGVELAQCAWLPFDVFATSAQAIEMLLRDEVPCEESGGRKRTTDSKTDNSKKIQPDNKAVGDLCRQLARELPEGRTQIEIARELTGEEAGHDGRAQSLLRQARRFSHLWRESHK
jgi:hypothetical protein